MKTQTAKLNYLRIAPRKVRLVADSIRGLPINEAEAKLILSPKRISKPLAKLLRSAISNAKHNQKLDSKNLVIKEIRVDEGPTLKRFMPRAMGRATPVLKRSSHITLVLKESDKLRQERFVIKKRERVSRREKIKRDTKDKETTKQKSEEQARVVKQPGFIKRIFRRKAV